MLMLKQDRRRRLMYEVRGFQNFKVVAFGVDMKEVHTRCLFSQNLRQGTQVDDAFEDERFNGVTQCLVM